MKRHLCVICLVFTVALGIVMQIWPVPSVVIHIEDGQVVSVTGKVYQKEIKYNKSIIYLENAVLCSAFCQPSNQKEQPSTSQLHIGKVMCYMDIDEKGESLPCIGSTVWMRGEFQNFKTASNPGEFDVKEYYSLLGMYCSLHNVELVHQGREYSKIREMFWRFGQKCASVYELCMNETDASILKAMLLGQKGELDAEVKALYQSAGIAHVLAISGLHISLIGNGIYKVLRRLGLPMGLAAIGGMFFLLTYVMLTGSSASSFRAVCMFLIYLLADVVGRTYDMLTAMSVAAVLLLLEQPQYLYQTGFLFSFGAILGIGSLGSVLYELGPDRGIARKCWNAFSMSLSVSLVTLPLQLSVYYSVNRYSVFLNLLIIPCMSVILCTGGAGLLLGLCNETVGSLVLQVCHFLLLFYEKSSEWILAIPGSIWITGVPAVWQIVLYYSLLCVGIYLFHRNKRIEQAFLSSHSQWGVGRKLVLAFGWLVICVIVLTVKLPSDMKITFLDVGQGDAIVIQSETGHTYLLDGGSSSNNQMAEYQLIPYLKYSGIDTIECALISHLDEDHCNGVIQLLKTGQMAGIRVKRVLLSAAEIQDEVYEELCRIASDNMTDVSYMKRGDYVQDGKLYIECVYPFADTKVNERNAASLALAVRYEDFLGMFMGDLGAIQETEIMEETFSGAVQEGDEFAQPGGVQGATCFAPPGAVQGETCILLKAGHHGSRYSSSEAFLEWLQPNVTVISCGENNSYGHPHAEMLERLEKVGSEVLVTKECGAIIVEIGENVEVRRWRDSE